MLSGCRSPPWARTTATICSAHFLIANGGEGIVTPDGKLHTDDPQIREAAIKSIEFMTNLYKDGVVPPEALSWNDADDNNGFHEKLFMLTSTARCRPNWR